MDELTRRMDHLEELEAWEELYGQHGATWQPPQPPSAHHRSSRSNPQMRPPPQPRCDPWNIINLAVEKSRQSQRTAPQEDHGFKWGIP